MKIAMLEASRDDTTWDEFVLRHPLSSGYHTLAWRHIISDVFGHRTFYLMAKDAEGSVRGVLPLVLTKSPLFGRFLTSMAFFNYGGVLADNAESSTFLLDEAAQLAKEEKAFHIEMRQAGPVQTDWPVRCHKVSMRLALPPVYDTLLKGYPSKLRSQIRRAQKEGMDVRLGGGELLEEYYQVFARCMRDLGTPVYEKGFFQSIVETFPKEVSLCVVSLKGDALAAGLVYGFRQTLEIPWAASDKRYNKLAPNMLLYNAVLEYACRQGYKEFDFGRSSVDSGTYRFKQQWGAQPHQLYWYYWLADGQNIPQLNPSNPKFRAAIALWQRLPLVLTKLVGPHIVKYLP